MIRSYYIIILQIDENCLKAFVRKGKALQSLKKFDEAISVFNEILTKHADKEKLVKGTA